MSQYNYILVLLLWTFPFKTIRGVPYNNRHQAGSILLLFWLLLNFEKPELFEVR